MRVYEIKEKLPCEKIIQRSFNHVCLYTDGKSSKETLEFSSYIKIPVGGTREEK